MKTLVTLCALLSITFVRSQDTEVSKPFPVDTVILQNREVVLFSDQTWQYLEDLSFDGILNPYLNNLIQTDTNFNFTTFWDNHTCYMTDNDLTVMKDSFWLCLTDSMHPNFSMPVPGHITSGYKYRGGRFHRGVDLALRVGDTVSAAFAGKVRYAKYNTSGYGNLVIVRHFNGLETYYAHLSQILVTPNQYVTAGQVLGLGGATGRAYGPHLHFECRLFDNSMNPEYIFDFKAGSMQDCNLIVKAELFEQAAGWSTFRQPKPGVTYATGRVHRVRKDDSLWRISQMYGTSVQDLCSLNGISENAILQIGQTIKVK